MPLNLKPKPVTEAAQDLSPAARARIGREVSAAVVAALEAENVGGAVAVVDVRLRVSALLGRLRVDVDGVRVKAATPDATGEAIAQVLPLRSVPVHPCFARFNA